MRQAVGWLTPIPSAKRTDHRPLSDWRASHRPVSQPTGSFVECSGVRIVTVN